MADLRSVESHYAPAQHRVDNVTIVHAGEDMNTVIRPLANCLEKNLKLGHQAEFALPFKQGTDIAEYIRRQVCGEEKNLVIVISDGFYDICSKNPSAFQQIESEIFLHNNNPSKFALVTPSSTPPQWSHLRCINLGMYVNEMEAGNLVEAVYKQWFGPQATLSSQTEVNLHDLSLGSQQVEDDYSPDRVKIIHALTQAGDRERHWGKLAAAIEDVANLETTTQSRRLFKSDCSIAQTLLSDLDGFVQCTAQKCTAQWNANAVIMWCPNMLSSLNQDHPAKAKFIEILCQDKQPRKLYAHFLFGVDQQQMIQFSQQLWTFLSGHQYIVYIEARQVIAPNVDYKPFAQIFLSIWAGSRKEPKRPAESSDPSMTSLEASVDDGETVSSASVSSSQFPSSQLQFQAQQNHNGDRLVMNGESMNQRDAILMQAQGTAPSTVDPAMLGRTASAADPKLAAEVHRSREARSGQLDLRGMSLQRKPGTEPAAAGLCGQPRSGCTGFNRMPCGSTGSYSIDSAAGIKFPSNGISWPTLNSPAETLSVGQAQQCPTPQALLPSQGPVPNGGQMVQAHQPVNNRAGVNVGQNRVAPSGFVSQSLPSGRSNGLTSQEQSSMGMESVPERSLSFQANEVDGSVNGGSASGPVDQDCLLSTHRNPVRLSSDADRELLAEFQRVEESQSGRHSLPDVGTPSEPGRDANRSNCHVFRSWNSESAAGMNSIINGVNGSTVQPADEELHPLRKPLSELDEDIIRMLKISLDPMKEAICDWRDLASHFKVESQMRNYWKGIQGPHFSPTEQLFDWLKAQPQMLTLRDLMAGLTKIERFDVLRHLKEVLQIQDPV